MFNHRRGYQTRPMYILDCDVIKEEWSLAQDERGPETP